MGHNISAVIGGAEAVARVVEAARSPEPTPLPGGLLIAPLGHEQIDRLTCLRPGARIDGFKSLSEGLERAVSAATGAGRLAYVETNYFGSTGSQAACVFSQGKLVFQSALPVSRAAVSRTDPINVALRMIGVEAEIGKDEFDTLGLDRFRDHESLGLTEWDDD
ncbi:hypothetical protein [Sphingosinicella sp. BN140058]|uniref:hypothetical protein n=1 Tax=Sphingosinicella sp. BN140058 TaxID=1892855 RepID=UPI001011B849|nr:hypothetical protein [Sphingosinicella sp. BN140058]QAY78153.1 hypothetical protein ETR14_17685 [Sphingosinicella sp. BN140058]